MPLPFLKMHGAGNDFVIFDARTRPVALAPSRLQEIAARRTGIGCDQVIVMEQSQNADVFMRIYNADGGEVFSCGNATRCVGWLIMRESGRDACAIETKAGILQCRRAGQDRIRVDMGKPRLEWGEVPLSHPADTNHLDIAVEGLKDPAAVSMGNPHMVFAVSDVSAAPVAVLGPTLEHHLLFPERANVSFAQVVNDKEIRLRVWERGAGETLACGTAACATLVALHRRGLVANKASVHLPGGVLEIEWDKISGHVWMTGPVALSFQGVIPAEWRGLVNGDPEDNHV
ncbi:MAG: diaminopimelate epimerase [Pseudomonadota bacterium]|nr:diaminopimelate epimerase [Pseudomonadota bacterium]